MDNFTFTMVSSVLQEPILMKFSSKNPQWIDTKM
jgi:hypothetical protein